MRAIRPAATATDAGTIFGKNGCAALRRPPSRLSDGERRPGRAQRSVRRARPQVEPLISYYVQSNVIGSFVIGIFFGLAERNHVISPSMNVFLITGFCGGFTTFSSFADDMYLLLQQRHWLCFGLYVGLSFLLGLLLVWLGRSLVRTA